MIIKNPIGQEITIIGSHVYEYCHECEEEVKLEATFDRYQSCHNCLSLMLPCSLCDADYANCNKCHELREKDEVMGTVEGLYKMMYDKIMDNEAEVK